MIGVLFYFDSLFFLRICSYNPSILFVAVQIVCGAHRSWCAPQLCLFYILNRIMRLYRQMWRFVR